MRLAMRLFRTAPLHLVCLLPVLAALTGCTGLREADGTEAAIRAKAAGLAVLTSPEGETAHDAATGGLLKSPALREAASLVAASADDVRVQRAALFPSLGLTLGGGIGDAGRGDAALDLEGRQLVLDFGDTKRAVTTADIDLQINYLAFQQTVDETLVAALSAYDATRMYRDLLDVRREQLAAMRKLEALIRARTETGAATSPDLLETRKRIQAAEFLVHDTQLAEAEAQDRLLRLTGLTAGGSVVLPDGSCQAPGGTDDMRMAQLRLAKAQLKLERAERSRLPKISLNPVVRGGGDGGANVGLNMGVQSDILEGGALTARANAARNAHLGAQAGVEAAQLDADLGSRGLQRNLSAARQKMSMLERQIALVTETRALYRSQYFDLGTRQLSELLDNEEEFYNRQAEIIELRADMVEMRLECAARSRSLRSAVGVDSRSVYGFPLAADAL
ncbi:TolC family protein [Pseudotabrizicola formosa]|uniref:TolC family protein n=1 Tax=Pseudotabrizicola formosa TaxID=2030009 RepID=UPI000CD131DD|nr:TolC family protein [Pseudotabrizicola formosa]